MQEEHVLLESTSTLEKALVLCLLIYYIKDLTYPLAFGQILLLMQKTLVKDSLPKACMNGKLKDLISKLEEKHVI